MNKTLSLENRILDQLYESEEEHNDYDPDTVSPEDLYENDDMYH